MGNRDPVTKFRQQLRGRPWGPRRASPPVCVRSLVRHAEGRGLWLLLAETNRSACASEMCWGVGGCANIILVLRVGKLRLEGAREVAQAHCTGFLASKAFVLRQVPGRRTPRHVLGSVLSVSEGRGTQNIEMQTWASGCKDLRWEEIQNGFQEEVGLARSRWHQGCPEWDQGQGCGVCVCVCVCVFWAELGTTPAGR